MRRSIGRCSLALLIGCSAGVMDIEADEDGSSYGFEVTKHLASDAEERDRFGHEVSLDGDTLVVGTSASTDTRDAAYIFQRDSGDLDWREVARLTAPDALENQRFGTAVSVSGDIVVVGAYSSDDLGSEAGKVYIFKRDPGGLSNWGLVAKLFPDDGDFGHQFGWSVDLDADTLIVGAPCYKCDEGQLGSTYVFERNLGGPDAWGRRAKLTTPPTAMSLGWSVAIQGDTAVVGAFSAEYYGRAYIYERHAGGADGWGLAKELSGGDHSEDFGRVVDIDQDTIAVGGDRYYQHKVAHVFERDSGGPGQWGETATLRTNSGCSLLDFAQSVQVLEDTIVVGEHPNIWAFCDGFVHVFERHAGGVDQWSRILRVSAFDGGDNRKAFGSGVAFDGAHLFAGDFGSDEECPDETHCNSGAIYAYRLFDCDLRLDLERDAVHPGDALEFSVGLHHNRFKTVSVSFDFRVEDASGQPVIERSSVPQRLEPRDLSSQRLSWNLPDEIEPGDYELVVTVDEMQQGRAEARTSFSVIEVVVIEPVD